MIQQKGFPYIYVCVCGGGGGIQNLKRFRYENRKKSDVEIVFIFAIRCSHNMRECFLQLIV